MGSLFRSAKKCGLKVFVSSLSLISWPEASIFLLVLPRSKEPEMFSIITEAHHQLPPASRSSSDRSDSSTGGQPVSMMPSAKTEAKMFGSNLYWEEEHLETSLHGGSEPGLLTLLPGSWRGRTPPPRCP